MDCGGTTTVPDEWGVLLAVLGMVVATLLMAAFVSRYQAYQAMVRHRVRHIEHRLIDIASALHVLRPVPLSRELRVTLRGEVLARYRRIRRLYRGYPDVMNKIAEAEVALNGEGASVGSGVGRIESEQMFRAMAKAFVDLIDLMERGDTLQPIPQDVRAIFRRELGERRAEVYSRYYLVEAARCEQRNNFSGARINLSNLMQLLRHRGPQTAFVRELHAETERALAQLGLRIAAQAESKSSGQMGDEAALAR